MFKHINKPCCIIEILHIFIVCLIFILLRLHFYFLYKSVTGLFNFFKRKILGYRITVITQDFGPCNAGSIPAGPTN